MSKNIALSGRSGSGKTAVAEYLISEHGYTRCSTGQACREVCKILFGTDSKAILNKVTDAMKTVDADVWPKAAMSSVVGKEPIVFDSMRFASDYLFLKERGFVMWRIEAPLAVRLPRMEKRGQVVQPEDDEHRAETELDQHEFDQVISNPDSELDLLYLKIEKVLD